MVPDVTERHLYMVFRELLETDLSASRRIAGTGNMNLLL